MKIDVYQRIAVICDMYRCNRPEKSRFALSHMLALVFLSGSIAGAVLVYHQFPERLHFFPRRSQAAKIVVMNGSDQWVGVNRLTAMTSAPFLPPDTGTLEVSP